MTSLYVFDTCSIRVLGNYYPQRFPSFWENFDRAIEAGLVVSTREVYRELQVQASGWLLDWIKEHRDLFRTPGQREQEFVAEIFRVPHFRTLVGQEQLLKGNPVADPFVIAAAKVQGGCVVTQEVNKPNAAKIPNICNHFGIPCCNMEGFLEQNGWTF